MASLKAENWYLKGVLSESSIIAENMRETLTNVALEKYELIEELNKSKYLNEKLNEKLESER